MGRAAGKRVRRGGSSRAPQAGSPTGGRMGNSRPPRWPQPGAAGGLGAGTIPVFSCPWESQDFSFGGLRRLSAGPVRWGHVPALKWDGASRAEAPAQRTAFRTWIEL